MKLCLLLALCAVAAAAPSLNNDIANDAEPLNILEAQNERSILVNALVNRLFAFIRRVINNGSTILGLPPMDPLELDLYHLEIPAGLINLKLVLRNILVTGLGGFVVNSSHLDLRAMTFDVRITFPELDIGAENYNLIGDLYGAIPLFGNGKARFRLESFTFSGKLFLKQSEDGNSVLIDRIENASFDIPSLKSNLTGVIGGGSIDAIVNAFIEDVLISYANRFQGAIASTVSDLIVTLGNPVLDQLNTWQWIAPLIPRW